MKTNKSDTIIKTHIAEEAFTGRPPRKSNRSIPISLLGVRYRSIRSLAKSWNVNERTLRYRLSRFIEVEVTLISKDRTTLMYIGLDGKARYKLNWSDEPQTARQVIEHYRPDLLEAYDKYNPTGEYTPYKINEGSRRKE